MTNAEMKRKCMSLQESIVRLKGIVNATELFYERLGESIPQEVDNINKELLKFPEFINLDTQEEINNYMERKKELNRKILPYHRYAHDKLYPERVLYTDSYMQKKENQLGIINW